MNRIVFIVGDSFVKSADDKIIFAYNSLVKTLKSNDFNVDVIYFEQGVSEEKVEAIKKMAFQLGMEKLKLHSYFDRYRRCPKELAHKKTMFNVLISEPLPLDEKTYQSKLMVDECCAEMRDHTTGKHIQGMIFVEAARQMTIATLEKFLIPARSDEKFEFAMNILQCEFYNYAAPMAVDLNLKVLTHKKRDRAHIVTLNISFHQAGKNIASIFRKVSVYDKKLIEFKEFLAIKNYVDAQCQKEEMIAP
jgi:hypothetical protein